MNCFSYFYQITVWIQAKCDNYRERCGFVRRVTKSL